MTPLRAIGWPYAGQPDNQGWRDLIAAHPAARPARVIEQHRSGYIVAEAPGAGFSTESPQEWQRPPGYRKGNTAAEDRAAVGDWVLVEEIVSTSPLSKGPASGSVAPSRSRI